MAESEDSKVNNKDSKKEKKGLWQFLKKNSCGIVATLVILAFVVLALVGNKTSLNLYKISLTSEPTQSVPAICRSLFGEVTQIRTVMAEQSSTLSQMRLDAIAYAKQHDNPADPRSFGNSKDKGPGYLNWEERRADADAQQKNFDSTVAQLTGVIAQVEQKCDFNK